MDKDASKLRKRTCPICKKDFETDVIGQLYCKTACRKKAGLISKYYRNYAVGKI